MLKRLASAEGTEAVYCPKASFKATYGRSEKGQSSSSSPFLGKNRRENAIAFWDELLRVSAESGSWKCFDSILKQRPSHLPMQSDSFVDIVKKLEDEDDERRIKKLLDQAINFYQEDGEIDSNKLIIDYGLLLADATKGRRGILALFGARPLDESSVVWGLGCNRPSLLLHPLCYSFLCFKWMKLSIFFFLNFAFYVAFLCSLTAFVVQEAKGIGNDKNFYALFVLSVMLAAREGYQLRSKFGGFVFFQPRPRRGALVWRIRRPLQGTHAHARLARNGLHVC
jgi:hypothetical protein